VTVPLGSAARPLRVAIVGSGPSGFYAAEALLDAPVSVEVDVLERLPVPYGLVRHGVAPDHAKLKSVTATYAEIAGREGFRYLGNVEFGRDVSASQLGGMYHAVIVAVGAEEDRRLGIPGEHLEGVHAAADFVAWYNGRPGFANLEVDLSQDVAVVAGHGNVAVDVCRLIATPVDALRSTDIASHALDALASSRVREIHLVGRRGPAQAKFTPKELRELASLPGWQVVVDPATMELNEASRAEAADPSQPYVEKNLKLLQSFAAQKRHAPRAIHVRFQLAPISAQGDERLRAVVLERQRLEGRVGHQQAVPTGVSESLQAGLLLRSVGYRGTALPGLPFDVRGGLIPNVLGRVIDERGSTLAGWYVTGWIKRGATGIIGTNRLDSVETVRQLIEDLPLLDAEMTGRTALQQMLAARGHTVISFDDWLSIERAEQENGRRLGKVAEKFVDVSDMLRAALGCEQSVPGSAAAVDPRHARLQRSIR